MEPAPDARPRGAMTRSTALVLVSLAGAAAYANSLSVPFHFDDAVVLLGEPSITRFEPSPASRRFLGDLSFAVSYRMFGEEPGGYHAVNLAIHLAAAGLVYLIARLLLRTRRMEGSSRAPPWIAVGAALVFVSHPLQTQAVTYIVQRYASLAALLCLGAVYAHLRWRLAPARPAAAAWCVASVAAAAAAMWTKENAYVLPLLVAAVELTFLEAPLRRRVLLLAPAFVTAAFMVIALLPSGPGTAAVDAATRIDTSMPRSVYLLTQLRVVASYLRLLVLPFGQNLDHDVALSRSLAEWPVLLALAVHLALIAGATLAVRRGSRRDPRWRHVGFGIAWFYLALLVESSVIPIPDVMYEHRAYLPSFGFALAAAALASMAADRARSPRAAAAAAAVAIVGLVALTAARNRVWRDDLSLWSDAAAKSPHKARPLNNVGAAYFRRGDLRSAASMYLRAIEADPGYTKAYFNLGEALHGLGEYAAAVPPLRAFASFHPDYPDTYRLLAECLERLGESSQAAVSRDLFRRAKAAEGGPLPAFFR